MRAKIQKIIDAKNSGKIQLSIVENRVVVRAFENDCRFMTSEEMLLIEEIYERVKK